MFLPIGDHPNARGVPLVTLTLIAVNVAVYLLVTLPLSAEAPALSDPLLREYAQFLARHLPSQVPLATALSQVSAYDLVLFKYGFRPDAPGVLALFSSMFLHAGLLHLAGNMLFLWIYGDNVEHRLGALRFLFWYLMTGVAAALFQAFLGFGPPLPMVGASGAISGVLGFYFLWFPHHSVRVFILLFPFYIGTVMLPARLVLGIYLVLDNLLPFLLAPAGGVAHGAHIGGFVAGLVAAAWLRLLRRA